MKKLNLLSRAEMKKVVGGVPPADVCDNMTGVTLADCRYNNCMSGWDTCTHTEAENNNKIDTCYASSNFPT
ncbi:MAG: hypothetical protein EOP00_29370 [Pedobacter sp.]|nr:MAG: hypothetical protein EOP00_29370 [Pedobacter sp.]